MRGKSSMSIAASKRPSLDEYRARERRLEAELARLSETARDQGMANRTDRWARTRARMAELGKELASVRASIAQIELSPNLPSRTFSNRVPR